MGPVEQKIHEQLAGLSGAEFTVKNESHLHAGHAGHDGSGESHFALTINWDGFAEMSRVARERHVHGLLGPELMAQIHALSLKLAPKG
jgi:Stress-induced morphogen (activity unknown)